MYLCAKMIMCVFSCFACTCVTPKHMKCPMCECPQTRTLQNIRTERRLGNLLHVIVHVRTWRPASLPTPSYFPSNHRNILTTPLKDMSTCTFPLNYNDQHVLKSSFLALSPGEGNSTPLQYSCLENPMDGGAW